MSNRSPIRLIQFTDTHVLGDKEAVLRGVKPYANLLAVRQHASQRLRDVDGVLLTGDLVNDDANGYSLIREAFGTSPVPIYCVPGNHDLPNAMQRELNVAPFRLQDHVVLGNWLVVLLNTWIEHSAGGQIGEAQLTRLSALLQEHPKHHALVCLHHHPIKMSSDWLDKVGLRDADAFNACIKQHPNVRGVLWGHVHQSLDTVVQNVRYMATPATCVQFLPHSAEFATDTRPPGYRTLELNDDGSIETRVVWVD